MGLPRVTISYVAPVCPVSRDQPVSAMVPTQIPTIPLAVDLPSAIAAINQMARMISPATIPVPIPLLTAPGSANVDNSAANGKTKKPGWREVDRGLDGMYVTNPQDKSQSVQIPQIHYLKYVENQTNVNLVWYL